MKTKLFYGLLLSFMALVAMPVMAQEEVDIFKTKSGKTIKIYSLMHACVRIVYEGEEIQIDPVRQLGNRTIECKNF